jgi:hypothetical protein
MIFSGFSFCDVECAVVFYESFFALIVWSEF